MGAKLNFTPIGSNVITTCHLEKEDLTYVVDTKKQPKIKELQQVLSVGPTSYLKVGDWVLLDLGKYIKHEKIQSKIRAGVGGEGMIQERFVPPFIAVPGATEPYLKINDRDIEGTVDVFSKLSKELKEFTTMKEYEEAIKKNAAEGEAAKAKFDKESAANSKHIESDGPLVVTSSSKIKMYE